MIAIYSEYSQYCYLSSFFNGYMKIFFSLIYLTINVVNSASVC